MMAALSRKVASKLYSGGVIQEADQELYEYALNIALSGILHFVTCTALGATFGLIPASLALFISFAVIRKFAGGFHASTPLKCYLFSIVTHSLLLALVKFTPHMHPWLFCALLLAPAPLIICLAPSYTEAKPLSTKERKVFRIVAILLYAGLAALSWCIFHFYSEQIGFSGLLGLCLEGFVLALAKIEKLLKSHRKIFDA